MRTAALILAAGNSSRLGQPKQLLVFEGKSLLKRAVEAAENSVCEKVFVVTGAYAEKIRVEIDTKSTELFHTNWEKGMGSSVAFGLKEILKREEQFDAVVILLCDQPFVDATLIDDLIHQKNSDKKGIVVSAYADTLGAPVLYDQKYFPELLILSGHEGAKKILLKHPEDVVSVPFVLGKVDVDTREDYEGLNGRDNCAGSCG